MTQVTRPTPRRLDAFTLPSEPGNERLALARVAKSVAGLDLPEARLERLKTAVAEATMNAIEHGNQNRAEIPVEVEVTQAGNVIVVAITDQGGEANPEPVTPRSPTSSGSWTAGRVRAAGACSSSATWSTPWT
jgi:anti-sigma regulatory factor (Ser/Thr protein kinase)